MKANHNIEFNNDFLNHIAKHENKSKKSGELSKKLLQRLNKLNEELEVLESKEIRKESDEAEIKKINEKINVVIGALQYLYAFIDEERYIKIKEENKDYDKKRGFLASKVVPLVEETNKVRGQQLDVIFKSYFQTILKEKTTTERQSSRRLDIDSAITNIFYALCDMNQSQLFFNYLIEMITKDNNECDKNKLFELFNKFVKDERVNIDLIDFRKFDQRVNFIDLRNIEVINEKYSKYVTIKQDQNSTSIRLKDDFDKDRLLLDFALETGNYELAFFLLSEKSLILEQDMHCYIIEKSDNRFPTPLKYCLEVIEPLSYMMQKLKENNSPAGTYIKDIIEIMERQIQERANQRFQSEAKSNLHSFMTVVKNPSVHQQKIIESSAETDERSSEEDSVSDGKEEVLEEPKGYLSSYTPKMFDNNTRKINREGAIELTSLYPNTSTPDSSDDEQYNEEQGQKLTKFNGKKDK